MIIAIDGMLICESHLLLTSDVCLFVTLTRKALLTFDVLDCALNFGVNMLLQLFMNILWFIPYAFNLCHASSHSRSSWSTPAIHNLFWEMSLLTLKCYGLHTCHNWVRISNLVLLNHTKDFKFECPRYPHGLLCNNRSSAWFKCLMLIHVLIPHVFFYWCLHSRSSNTTESPQNLSTRCSLLDLKNACLLPFCKTAAFLFGPVKAIFLCCSSTSSSISLQEDIKVRHASSTSGSCTGLDGQTAALRW